MSRLYITNVHHLPTYVPRRHGGYSEENRNPRGGRWCQICLRRMFCRHNINSTYNLMLLLSCCHFTRSSIGHAMMPRCQQIGPTSSRRRLVSSQPSALQDPSTRTNHCMCLYTRPSPFPSMPELLLTMTLFNRYEFDVPIAHVMNMTSVFNASPAVLLVVPTSLLLIPIE